MPLQKLQFRPGVNREGTTLSNEGGWYDCDKIRFRSGYPEKIGGWAALSYSTFLGVCRSLWNWVTLKNFNLLGVGTNLKFYIEQGGSYYDITPIRETNANPGAGITLTASGTTLTVSDPLAENLQVNDFVTIAGAGTIGGVDVNGEYQIATVTSATTYTVNLPTSASGSNSAATITIAYQINTGLATTTVGTGWGAPPWSGFVQGSTSTTLNGLLTAAATSVVSVSTTGFTASNGLIMVGNANLQMIKTSLPADISNSVTTIPVLSTNYYGSSTPPNQYRFSTTGSILIDTEIITYTGLSSDGLSFTGCTRGASGTTAATHSAGAVVFQNVLEDISYATTTATNFNTATRGADGTTARTFATGSLVFKADSFPGWGQGYPSSATTLQLRLWSQSNFGEYLLFNPRGGALYIWQPGTAATPGVTVRGVQLLSTSSTPAGWASVAADSTCPTQVNQLMVSDTSRITIAFGCNDPTGVYATTALDPMQIRWTAQESYTVWTPATTNQAGDYRLSHGSEIIGALQTRQEIVVWTDSAIYSMQYLGPPFVYSFTLLADNISIVSPNAMATANGVVYWMGVDKFYTYSGRVETLPCSVRQFIFNDINRDQEAQFNAGTNEGYSEVWWNYCSKDSTVIDRYVIFNYLDRVWYYGTLNRTAWLDSALRQYPMAATTNNLVVYHEAAVDNGETNPPAPISAFIQSSDFDIEDGHNYGFVWRIIPDITFDGSDTEGQTTDKPYVQFTVRPRQNPGSGYGAALSPTVTSGQSYAGETTYLVQQFTEIIYSRVRGRQMAFRVESDSPGTQWQLGVPRIDVRPDGRN